MLGDYVNVGVRTVDNRTDIPKLLSVLKTMGPQDYMHLVWKEDNYPHAWEDFQLMALQFQEAGIRLWLCLTPPSEGVPEPYGEDYVKWALACSEPAKRYPIIQGICMDDFNGNVKKFTPVFCQEMMNAAHKNAPHLSLLVVCYYGYQETIQPHVEAGAIDGVIFPYFYPHKNLSDTSRLLPQITTYREWLNEQTKKGGYSKIMPLMLMVYGVRHSQSTDAPTPDYVKECLEIGLQATKDGLASGVVTYCLQKDKADFVAAVASVYTSNHNTEHNK